MGKTVTLIADKKEKKLRKQYKITIPKVIVDIMEYDHQDKFILTWDKEDNSLKLKKKEKRI